MADETKVQGPGIEQGGLEAPPAPGADKAPEQLETENLTGPAADGQPEQAAPAEESKGEPEKSNGKMIDITDKMAQGHDTLDKADKASGPPAPDKDTRPDGEKPRRGRTPKEKTGPEDKATKPKSRTSKAEKSAPAKGKVQRDKAFQGKKGQDDHGAVRRQRRPRLHRAARCGTAYRADTPRPARWRSKRSSI